MGTSSGKSLSVVKSLTLQLGALMAVAVTGGSITFAVGARRVQSIEALEAARQEQIAVRLAEGVSAHVRSARSDVLVARDSAPTLQALTSRLLNRRLFSIRSVRHHIKFPTSYFPPHISLCREVQRMAESIRIRLIEDTPAGANSHVFNPVGLGAFLKLVSTFQTFRSNVVKSP